MSHIVDLGNDWKVKANFPRHNKRLVMSDKTYDIILNYKNNNVDCLDRFELHKKIVRGNKEYPKNFYLFNVIIYKNLKKIHLNYMEKSI